MKHYAPLDSFRRETLLWAVHHAISIGYADGAYIYARMLARYYFRVTCNRAWYDVIRAHFTPERPQLHAR